MSERADALASRAITLLELLDRQDRELAELGPERELELVAGGLIHRLNVNRQWTLELAQGFATASIAASLLELADRQTASEWLEAVKSRRAEVGRPE
jgi:hypothetical protein